MWQKIHIKVPETAGKKYKNGAEITYQLANSAYVLIGIAFSPTKTDEVARDEFPEVLINRDPEWSEMTVANMCEKEEVPLVFGIVIQEVSSGDIGIYDPSIIIEPLPNN